MYKFLCLHHIILILQIKGQTRTNSKTRQAVKDWNLYSSQIHAQFATSFHSRSPVIDRMWLLMEGCWGKELNKCRVEIKINYCRSPKMSKEWAAILLTVCIKLLLDNLWGITLDQKYQYSLVCVMKQFKRKIKFPRQVYMYLIVYKLIKKIMYNLDRFTVKPKDSTYSYSNFLNNYCYSHGRRKWSRNTAGKGHMQKGSSEMRERIRLKCREKSC